MQAIETDKACRGVSYASAASFFFRYADGVQAVFAARFCRVGRRLISSACSRMNQLHCAVAGAHVRQRADVRRDGPAEPVPRASFNDFWARECCRTGRRRRFAAVGTSAAKFAGALLDYETPARRAVARGPAGRIRSPFPALLRGIQGSAQAADGHRDTFLKQKCDSRRHVHASRPACDAQPSVESRMACPLRHWTHRRAVDQIHRRWGAANSSISSRGNSDEDQKQ
ncbi:hypothetical protein BamMEX5DRAFT_6188 [Burkholderia ambifaria MEX-5]|uniref:Uncharacterized protein n=1 Tax=Burkholderia ambifaria MEX-5 TaxID=396597 RepID=B1TEH2_9BURK|nr:hypothetical protein BamMEX5DRAFT_6188 [Burkholderia ambifaria MEX-5]